MSEGRTYTNPVFDEYMADPFVLKYNGEYYAYGTAPASDCAIPALHSTDLIHWHRLGDVLERPDQGPGSYWAPEVAYDGGTFYMYYSAGGPEGEGHQLRVATSTSPTGPFRDRGEILTPDDPFTIDAHPFRDDDGTWYLFYSRDFLEGDRVGTGIAVDRLVNMVALAGERTTVVRPHADWQLYQSQREWYGRTWDWFTIEGAFVRKHAGRYYCFFSGGSWKKPNYGVSYVVADHPMGPWNVEPSLTGPALLRTIPDKVIGPGHLSVVRGPDNIQEYMVYHAWDLGQSGRLMRIDAMHWRNGQPWIAGPTFTPQPAPPMPTFRDLFDGTPGALDTNSWNVVNGMWRQEAGVAHQTDMAAAPAMAILQKIPLEANSVLEVNLCAQSASSGGTFGIYAHYIDPQNYVEFSLDTEQPIGHWRAIVDGREQEHHTFDLRRLGSMAAYHRLLLTKHGNMARIDIDGVLVADQMSMLSGAGYAALVTRGAAASFDGVTLSFLPAPG